MRVLRRSHATAARVAVIALAFAIAMTLRAHPAAAITLTQAEAAPIPMQTAAPNGGAGNVADLDTKEPTEAVTTSNIVLLIAALGVLVGVLVVTRRKSGPDS